jgi:hypothetical protein
MEVEVVEGEEDITIIDGERRVVAMKTWVSK